MMDADERYKAFVAEGVKRARELRASGKIDWRPLPEDRSDEQAAVDMLRDEIEEGAESHAQLAGMFFIG